MKGFLIILSLSIISIALFAEVAGIKRSDFDHLKKGFSTTKNVGFKTVSAKGISIEIPTDWNRMDGKDQWIQKGTGNNVNLIIEKTSMNMDAYVKLSKTNMKKAIPSYELIKQENRLINGKKASILLGKFKMQGVMLEMYSIIINEGDQKIVVTVGGLMKNFNPAKSDFVHIFNSYKK